jgi:hypothetical protein
MSQNRLETVAENRRRSSRGAPAGARNQSDDCGVSDVSGIERQAEGGGGEDRRFYPAPAESSPFQTGKKRRVFDAK